MQQENIISDKARQLNIYVHRTQVFYKRIMNFIILTRTKGIKMRHTVAHSLIISVIQCCCVLNAIGAAATMFVFCFERSDGITILTNSDRYTQCSLFLYSYECAVQLLIQLWVNRTHVQFIYSIRMLTD